MRLTYKTLHGLNLTKELLLARKVAEFAIANPDKLSTKYVSHLGLNSAISGQVLRKYGRNKKIKAIRSVKLTISSHNLRPKEDGILVPQFKLFLTFEKPGKLCQIEFGKDFAYITVNVPEPSLLEAEKHIGVDFNTTGHSAVVAIKETGKVYKLGKKAEHTHKKYKEIRRKLQNKGLFGVLKKIKNRESRIVRDLNHKISKFIVDLAKEQKGLVTLEALQGIRGRKTNKHFKHALNSWSFRQLKTFIDYKAALAGVPVSYVNPAYTSKVCSRCGLLGERNDKLFKCPTGHVEHADTNAAFNIALLSPSVVRLQVERDANKGNLGIPQEATA